MSQQRKILALRIAARNGGHHRSGRINLGLLAQQIVTNVGVTNPDVHLTTDGGAEDTIILVTELFHGEPWLVWVDIVDASNVRDGGGRAGDELEAWWRTVPKHIFDDLDSTDDNEDTSTDEPFVGANGGDSIGFEKSVGGLIVDTEVVLHLGHDDRRRDGRRHGKNAYATTDCREAKITKRRKGI